MTRIWGTCNESHDYEQEGEVGNPRQRGNEKELIPLTCLIRWAQEVSSQESETINKRRESEFPPTEESGLETPPTEDNHTLPRRDPR